MVSMGQQVGDTTLTKVFVGGLAWETQKEALREHFGKYGEIVEAVIISDRATGRSKGYGFVTFKEAEAAKKACEDAAPVISGRRANCNLAAVGARRPRSSPARTAPIQPPRAASATPPLPPASAAGPWFYPSVLPPPSPLQHYYRAIPFYAAYGYPPSYVADGGYSTKQSQSTGGGSYPPPASYPGLAAPNAPVVPVYPWYHWHQQPQATGIPTQLLTPTTAGPITTVPAFVAKPLPAVPPTNGKRLVSHAHSVEHLPLPQTPAGAGPALPPP